MMTQHSEMTRHTTATGGRRSAVLAVLTAHIALSVGLLGDSAGFLAVAVTRAASDDAAFRDTTLQLLGMFALMFGIPLSFLALITGVTLTAVTRWSLFRYPWTIAKLSLIVSVIAVGALLLRPVLAGETAGGDGLLIGGSAWDVAALAVAVGLGVFKPGRRLGAPGDQAPGDQAPADQAPADQAPADQAPADQAPADQAPGEQAPGVRRP